MIKKLVEQPHIRHSSYSIYEHNLHSVYEVLVLMSKKINEGIDITNEMNEYITFLKEEGIANEVLKRLEIMVEDGTLEHLINVTLFEGLNEKINEFGSQLETSTNEINIIKIEKVNVLSFGVKGDGVTDDTQGLLNAIKYCKETENKRIYIPFATYLINSTLDFSGLSVECHGTIKVNFNGIGVIVGHVSTQGWMRDIFIREVTHSNYIDGDISIRVQGAKRLKFELGSMKKLQLYADGDISSIASIAYNTFNLIGQMDMLEIMSNKNATPIGWINENTFIKGRAHKILIDGNYGHNKNTFIDTCTEGGTITILNGHSNRFNSIRNEAMTKVTLGEKTHHNLIDFGFYSSNTNFKYNIIEDNGFGNVITSLEEMSDKIDFLNVNSWNVSGNESIDTSKISNVNDNTFDVAAWNEFCKVDIPLDVFYQSKLFIDAENSLGCRFYAYCLDSSKNILTGDIYKDVIWSSGMTYNSSTGAVASSTDQIEACFNLNKNNNNVKYIRFIYRPSKAIQIKNINMIVYAKTDKVNKLLSYKPKQK